MAKLNKVMLIGRLTRDPETKYTSSGTAITEFGFAVNRSFTTRDGERKEETCFLEITAWGRLGELVKNYLRKGRQAYVEGRLVYDEWQGPDGKKRSKIRVTAEAVQFLDAAGRESSAPQGEQEFKGGQQQQVAGPGDSSLNAPPPPSYPEPEPAPKEATEEGGSNVPF